MITGDNVDIFTKMRRDGYKLVSCPEPWLCESYRNGSAFDPEQPSLCLVDLARIQIEFCVPSVMCVDCRVVVGCDASAKRDTLTEEG